MSSKNSNNSGNTDKDNNSDKSSNKNIGVRRKAENISTSGREAVNALFTASKCEMNKTYYFFNPHYKLQGNSGDYSGYKGILNAYKNMITVKDKNGKNFVSKDNIFLPEWINKGERGLPTIKDWQGKTINFRDWNMIINLLQYDASDDTENDNNIWGYYEYACGSTLPGGFFQAENVRNEVTFIGLHFSEPVAPEQDSEKIDEEDLIYEKHMTRGEVSDIQDMVNRPMRVSKNLNSLQTKQKAFLRGFIVVKDLTHLPENPENYLYVEGLCANKRGVGREMLNTCIAMGQQQPYEGTKLAALTIVISYYWALNFRFYDAEGNLIKDEGDIEINKYFDDFNKNSKKNRVLAKEPGKKEILRPSMQDFIVVRNNWGKDKDENYIFTIEDYHYNKMEPLLQTHYQAIDYNKKPLPLSNKPREKAPNTFTDTHERVWKTYSDLIGEDGYYMYLKNDGKKSSGGGKNSKKRTKKKARRRKRKRTKRKRRRKRKRTKKRKRRRTKKRR